LVVVAPLYSYYAGTRIAEGRIPGRTVAYARTILTWWLIAATTLFLWWRLGRPFTLLGFAVPFDVRSIAGAGLSAASAAFAYRQVLLVERMPVESLARLRRGFGRALNVLPRSPAEYRFFLAVSLTAGICEELLYRGYLLAVASPFLTPGVAVVAGSLTFGAAHAYQGRRGMLKTALAGLLFSLVYVWTGSLLWPIVLHVVTDITGGTVGYRALRGERAS
jgi:uncharacterized protein